MLGMLRALLLVLPAAVAAQLEIMGIVISDPAPSHSYSGPVVSEHDARELATGTSQAMLRGSGRASGAQPDLAAWVSSQSAAWMPAGDGRVKQQLREVREEEIAGSDGQPLTQRVACVNGRCENTTAIRSLGHLGRETEDVRRLLGAGELEGSEGLRAVPAAGKRRPLTGEALQNAAAAELARIERSDGVGQEADEGDSSNSTDDADDPCSNSTDKDDGQEMEIDVDESDPLKALAQIKHARDVVEDRAQRKVFESINEKAKAFEDSAAKEFADSVAKRRSFEGYAHAVAHEAAEAVARRGDPRKAALARAAAAQVA